MNSPLTLDTIVIGAGLTGLTVGHHLLKDPNHKFTILEKEERAGGQIRTITKDSFTFESGPTSGIISTSEVADLFEDFPHLLNLATPLRPHYSQQEIRYEFLENLFELRELILMRVLVIW